ncbi:hypothetical protein HY405_00185 [Candidatus Microgenomates bacterium]|nr:hypothetical protein [Candidatus Microgenomates bacterium]
MKGRERLLHPVSQEILDRILVIGLLTSSTATRTNDFIVLTTPKLNFQEIVPHECKPKPERSDNTVKSFGRAEEKHVRIFGAICEDCDHTFTLKFSTTSDAIKRITKQEESKAPPGSFQNSEEIDI